MSAEAHLELAFAAAEEIGIVLERVDGVGSWEFAPGPLHQDTLLSLAFQLKDQAGIHVYVDMYVRFGEGSFKRPNVAIYCTPLERSDEATTRVPEAVIEILSKGYEAKDLEIGPPFYLRHGVKDVVVLDPRSGKVRHFREGSDVSGQSPVDLLLVCGCRVTV